MARAVAIAREVSMDGWGTYYVNTWVLLASLLCHWLVNFIVGLLIHESTMEPIFSIVKLTGYSSEVIFEWG